MQLPRHRRILAWVFEDGPDNAGPHGSPHDIGPAWLDTFVGERHVVAERLNSGRWFTRVEAQQLANENGWLFSADGSCAPPS
jgi:hypothetical protein